jgi:hypothetical protein
MIGCKRRKTLKHYDSSMDVRDEFREGAGMRCWIGFGFIC